MVRPALWGNVELCDPRHEKRKVKTKNKNARRQPTWEVGNRLREAVWSLMLDYLVIAPHPDDAELGAGGTILLLKAEGFRVGVLDLTDGEPTPFGSPELRRAETEAATAVLGLDWRGNLGLRNRFLAADLAARHKLAGT